MDINTRLRRDVRTFYAWIGSVALLAAAPMLGNTLIDRGTLLSRAAGVAVAIACALPWIWVVVTLIRRSDEFERRIHLVALAVAFFASNLAVITAHWLSAAGFIEPPSLLVLWFSFLMLWFAAIVGSKRYHEGRT
jgi:hypothetical protein